MDTALNYVGLAATTSLSTYVLDWQLYHGITMATNVGIATGVGSIVAKASHNYILLHRKVIGSASLNAGMAGAGAWGYIALMDSDAAKADAMP